MKNNFLWLKNTNIRNLVKHLTYKNHIFKFVGGCIRDSVINKTPKDFDIASNMTVEQNTVYLQNIHTIKVIPSGLSHGTISVVLNKQLFEVTSLRIDKQTYGRLAQIEYTNSFQEDSNRRDFTFNALYLDPLTLELSDYHNGINDIKNGIVKFIGNPYTRITEDYLRILRYFRFYSLYAKQKSENSILDILKHESLNLTMLSRERKIYEFSKIISSSNPTKTLQYLLECNIFDYMGSVYNNEYNINKFAILNFNKLISLENRFNINSTNLRIAFIVSEVNYLNNLLMLNTDLKETETIIKLKNLIQENANISFTDVALLTLQYNFKAVFFALIINCVTQEHKYNYFINIIEKLSIKQTELFPVTGTDLINIGFKENSYLKIVLRHLKLHFLENKTLSKDEYLIMAKHYLMINK